MAEVSLSIGGRHYDVHCGDGEEAQLIRLSQMIDAKTAIARKASPGLTEVRQLLFASILLADELVDARSQGSPQGSLALPAAADSEAEEQIAERLGALAARIEMLAGKLAGTDPTS